MYIESSYGIKKCFRYICKYVCISIFVPFFFLFSPYINFIYLVAFIFVLIDCYPNIYIIIYICFFVARGGSVGLAITQVIGLVGMCQHGMTQTAEVENEMTSVSILLFSI